MLSLRQKLLVGFGGLLLIIAVIGVKNIVQVTELGGAIDSILRQNYRSVLACQAMKEALEGMDDGAQAIILGSRKEGAQAIDSNTPRFEKALNIELSNITMKGEGEMARHLQVLFSQYKSAILTMEDGSRPPDKLHKIYSSELKPLFTEIKTTADTILTMNQKNMYDESQHARKKAALARHEMYVLLLMGALVAVCYMFLIGKWILRPIKGLTQSVDEIRQGNLDLVVKSVTNDEIGHLSMAFNEMTAGLRELRRKDEDKLVRMQQSTQQTFNSLPNAVAMIDLDGKIEISTETASKNFGLKRGVPIQGLHVKWMTDLFREALASDPAHVQNKSAPVIQHFVNAEEHYFQPTAVPILNKWNQMTGVILVLNDVTEQMEQDELKREFISTVSHQLKTPLTSVRMALHILLEEKIGSLTPKQADVLIAAREDSERLHEIIDNLLDISRIESGKMEMDIKPVSPGELVLKAAESFRSTAKDKGVSLTSEVPEDIPNVMADTTQISHVFANLISNALKYTPSQGTITISARSDEEQVRFAVSDTGKGIASQYLDRVFERFFRVPGQEMETGTGLGLSIVKEIIEAHTGAISATSSEGEGTTFSFTLPRADKMTALTSEKEEQTWLM